MTASSLPTALRAGAQGLYTLEAATGLVIANGTWLARDDFRVHIYHGTETAAIDWEAVTRALHAGELPGSAGEGRLLRLAASLAGQAPIVLGDVVTGLDDRNIQILVKAILHASDGASFPDPVGPPGRLQKRPSDLVLTVLQVYRDRATMRHGNPVETGYQGGTMIQITLGKKRLVDPATDPLHRTQIGWEEGLTDQRLHEIARGVWVMGKRAWQERYAVVSGAGIARQAIEIDQVIGVGGGRHAFVGRILQPGDPAYDLYVGKPAPNGSQQNPITYFESPLDRRVCACNCGTPINRGDFLPGHDQRAIHERIAQVGTVKDFITWFDNTWPGSASPEPAR